MFWSFRTTKKLRAVLELSQEADIALFHQEVALRSKHDWERVGRPTTIHFVVTAATEQSQTLRSMRFV